MSVEKQNGGKEISVKQIEIQKSSSMHTQSSVNPEETMERLPPSTSAPHVLKTANISENESFRNGKNEVRDWIENMDSRERGSVLAFVDESFLTALLSFASWSNSPSTTTGGTSKYNSVLSTILRRPGVCSSVSDSRHVE
jgi:hypothetical protein